MKISKKILCFNNILFPDSFLVVLEVLFFAEYFNLNFYKYSFLISITVFVSMLCEVPSGFISDKLGRKKMLILGSSIDIVGVLLLLLLPKVFNSYLYGIYFLEILRVIGRSIASGNFEILIYEMYQKSGENENSFKKDIATFFGVGVFLSSLFSFGSVILYEISIVLPILIDTAIKFFKVITYFFLNDSIIKTGKKILYKSKFNSLKNILKKESLKIFGVIIIFSLIFVISRVTFSLYQPIMQEAGINLKNYGITVFLLNIVLCIFTIFKKEKISKLSKKTSIIWVILILFFQIFLFFSKLINNYSIKYLYIVVFFILMQIIRIIAEGLSIFFLNQSIEKIENKSLFFSIYHSITSFIFVISLQIMGILNYKLNNFMLTYIGVCVFFGICILSLFLISENKSRSLNYE